MVVSIGFDPCSLGLDLGLKLATVTLAPVRLGLVRFVRGLCFSLLISGSGFYSMLSSKKNHMIFKEKVEKGDMREDPRTGS